MDILNYAGTILFSADVSTVKELVVAAVKANANLSRADLRGANLSRADLSGANLSRADLRGANLSDADLSRADLYDANLSGANLSRANLSDANLYDANLRGANLSGANLSRADLRGANLSDANLYDAKDITAIAIARLQFIPEEGPFIAWKKCQNGVIVKLMVPSEAKRSHGTGRKCRASEVIVMEVIGAEVGISSHDGKTEYRVGQTVTPDSFSDNRWDICAPGIHFYLTRAEAEAHN